MAQEHSIAAARGTMAVTFGEAKTGAIAFADGGEYVGKMKDDKRHGHGFIKFADGSEYIGEWKDGGYNGKGT